MSEIIPQSTPSQRRFNLRWSWLVLGIVIGCFLATFIGHAYAIKILTVIAIIVGVGIVLVLIAIPVIQGFVERWLSREFGNIIPPSEIIQKIEEWIEKVLTIVVDVIFHGRSASFKEYAKSFMGGAIGMIFLSQFKNRLFRVVFTLIATIGGIAGTLLLSNQNLLLSEQNRKIDQQIKLEEASRRSVFSSIELSRDIETELKDTSNATNSLSEELVSRVVWQCQSCRPYYYLDNDGIMIPEPRCPEKGNLLRILVSNNLDTNTLDEIYSRCRFREADLGQEPLTNSYLRKVDLSEAFLAGIDLQKAKFSDAILRNVNLFSARLTNSQMERIELHGANLEQAKMTDNKMNGAYFNNGNLYLTNLSNTVLIGADFSNAVLMETRFIGADLRKAKFIGANLKGANFLGANLQGADFSRAEGLSSEILLYCYSLYNSKGIPGSIIKELISQRKDLFDHKPPN